MVKQLKDEEAREKIVSQLDKNFLVEAGAGSGKTTSLVNRMLSLIITGHSKVEEIAAITFTRKGADHLRESLQNKLEKKLIGSKKQEREYLERALKDLHQSFTGTIHSFCARLLRERPVEAGIDPDFMELDELEEKRMKKEAWEGYLNKVRLNNRERLKDLEDLGISPLDLEEGFTTLNLYPDVEPITQKSSRPDFSTTLQSILSLVTEAMPFIPAEEPLKGYDSLQKALLSAHRLLQYLNLKQIKNQVKILSLFDRSLGVTLNRWNDRDRAKEFRDVKKERLKEDVEEDLRKWREHSHYFIVQFLRPAIAYFKDKRIKSSYLSFQDLLEKTATTLRDYPEVRKFFQKKYRYILVDEFQDTDPIQTEILFYLTSSQIEEGDWSKLSPAPGSLFLVGDPKQSIYRFRRADMDIYYLVKERIRESGGEILTLHSNFRSLHSLAGPLNPIFQGILPEKGNKYQAPFAPLSTLRDGRGTTEGIKILSVPGENVEKIVRCDADSIARIIRGALSGEMKLYRSKEELLEGISEEPMYRDFLILLRYKNALSYYSEALEAYGIPFEISGGSTLDQSTLEIRELLTLLKFLKETHNRVLLLAVLRGLFFGLSDDDLYQFKHHGGVFSIYSTPPSTLKEEVQLLFEEAYGDLKMYYQWSRTLPLTVVLKRLFIHLGLIPFTLGKDSGNHGCGNLYYLLEQVGKMEVEGYSFSKMVMKLEILLDSEIEGELHLQPETNKVRLMNLHKAKGLEAPVVFLAHPYKQVNIPPRHHINRMGSQPVGYFQFFKEIKYRKGTIFGQPPGFEDYQKEEEKYCEAEEIRLLYVAATRAKNLLIISSCLDKTNDKNPWKRMIENISPQSFISAPDISPQRASKGRELSLDKLQSLKENLSQWPHPLKTPSYSSLLPSEIGDSQEIVYLKRRSGGGKELGKAVHRILERLVKGKSSKTFMDLVIEEEGLNPVQRQELEEMIRGFQTSIEWERIMDSRRRFSEVPFTFKIEKGDRIDRDLERVLPSDQKVILLSGIIDLVFFEEDGWVIFDYKTDRLVDEKERGMLDTNYQGQLEIYKRVWEEMTGERVKESRIIYLMDWVKEDDYR